MSHEKCGDFARICGMSSGGDCAHWQTERPCQLVSVAYLVGLQLFVSESASLPQTLRLQTVIQVYFPLAAFSEQRRTMEPPSVVSPDHRRAIAFSSFGE